MGSALSYCAYLLYGKKIITTHPPAVTTAFVLTFAAAGFTLYGLAVGGISFEKIYPE
ncbi:MAG: hypothetical protein K6T65_03265 [Peptococcaceae bacterium]|nr:hypothetical protein [Peptococcaceae bacterium]